MRTLRDLMAQYPNAGHVAWIGIRPARKAPMTELETVEINKSGLVGDRHPSPGKRAVTLIQAEHLPVVAALTGEVVTPNLLRRNIVVSGINLISLRGQEVKIGTATLKITGPCAPCSRMEDLLGAGGYNAMRGHGGVTAEIVTPGNVAIDDEVRA